MIKVKSIFEPVEADDGLRIWVEPRSPIGLTLELIQSCDVDVVLPKADCSLGAANRSQRHAHPDRHYARKLGLLAESRWANAATLAALSATHRVTLLHEDADPAHNAAQVLLEFLSAQRARSDA